MEHMVHTTAILVTNCLSFRFLLCILVVVWLLFAAEDFIVMVMCSSVWCPLLIIVVVVECTSSCWCCASLAILLLVFLLLLLLLLLLITNSMFAFARCCCWICYFWEIGNAHEFLLHTLLCVCTWYIPYLPSNGTVRYICLHPSHCFTPTYYYIYITLLTVCRRFGNSTPIHQDTLGDWNEYR